MWKLVFLENHKSSNYFVQVTPLLSRKMNTRLMKDGPLPTKWKVEDVLVLEMNGNTITFEKITRNHIVWTASNVHLHLLLVMNPKTNLTRVLHLAFHHNTVWTVEDTYERVLLGFLRKIFQKHMPSLVTNPWHSFKYTHIKIIDTKVIWYYYERRNRRTLLAHKFKNKTSVVPYLAAMPTSWVEHPHITTCTLDNIIYTNTYRYM